MSAKTTRLNVAPVIAGEFRRLAQAIQDGDPKWRGADCIDSRGGKIDPQERGGELIIQAVECGLLRKVPKLKRLVTWANGGGLHPLGWPFAEGDARADSYAFPYKRCPRNVFNTVVGERQQIMTVFPPETERENEYYAYHPGRREATRNDPDAMTPQERELREQAQLASELVCKKLVHWPLPPHGLLSEFLPAMFPPGADKSWSDIDEAVVALHERNDRYARACSVLATLIEQEQKSHQPSDTMRGDLVSEHQASANANGASTTLNGLSERQRWIYRKLPGAKSRRGLPAKTLRSMLPEHLKCAESTLRRHDLPPMIKKGLIVNTRVIGYHRTN
jgi:hypothetical protein